MSTKAYGSITITDLLDTATYIYYSATGSSSVAGNWHKGIQSGDLYIGIYSGPPLDGGQPTNPTSAILNQLVISKYVGDTGVSIINVTPLYYAKENNTAPNKPPAVVIETSTAGGQWTQGIPELTSTYPYMFTCEQVHYDSTSVGTNGYTWTNPVLNNMITKFVENYNSLVADNQTWKQTYGERITTIENDYTTSSDVQSAITQSANSIKTEISGTYTTKSDAIKSDTLHYLATSYSTGVTTSNGDWGNWSTSIQTVTAEKKYLWIYHTYTKADNTTTNTTPVIYGVYGETGPQGPAGGSTTITSIKYAVTTTESQPTDSAFTDTTVPTVPEGQWLWTWTLYTDGTSAYTKAKQGKSGTNGTNGTSVTVSSIQYGTSSSASTQPSSWSPNPPTSIAEGTWLWVKTNYSNGSNATTKSYVGTDGSDGKSVYVKSVGKVGDRTTVVLSDGTTDTTLTIDDGTDGNDGQAGASGYIHVAWANSADGSTDFSTSVSTGKTYLGVYTDNTQADSQRYQDYSWSLIKGANGTSVTVSKTEYQSGTSNTTAPTGTWATTIPPVAEGNYLWTRVTYSDNSIAYSVAKQGKSGTDGADGKMLYATCSTAEATAAKVATITPTTTIAPSTGLTIAVKFAYANTALNPTLNVNSTGAIAIYAGEQALSGNYNWRAGDTCVFVYDGANWQLTSQNVDVSVGGRNLLLRTQDFSGTNSISHSVVIHSTATTDGNYNGCVVKTCEFPSTSSSSYIDICTSTGVAEILKSDTEFILSFWAKASENVNIISYLYNPNGVTYRRNSTGTSINNSGDSNITTPITTEWNRYWIIFKPINRTDATMPNNLIVCRLLTKGVSISLAGVKFEVGSTATDWTPAPEDIEASISSVSSDLSGQIGEVNTQITYIQQNYYDKSETDTQVSSVVGVLQKQIFGDDETGTEGEISKLQTSINQTAKSVEIVTENSDKFNSMVSAFSFEGNTFKITTKDAEIHSEQGANFYKYIDKAGNNVFEIDKTGTTAAKANVTGQIGIGSGSVDNYTEQWSIRKGAEVSGVGYNLDFVWVGGN